MEQTAGSTSGSRSRWVSRWAMKSLSVTFLQYSSTSFLNPFPLQIYWRTNAWRLIVEYRASLYGRPWWYHAQVVHYNAVGIFGQRRVHKRYAAFVLWNLEGTPMSFFLDSTERGHRERSQRHRPWNAFSVCLDHCQSFLECRQYTCLTFEVRKFLQFKSRTG